MFDFDKHLADIAGQTVLYIGDLMLDEFVYGEVSRISPEAPTPVIAVKRSELMMGGAGNVARNLVSLGARCVFIPVNIIHPLAMLRARLRPVAAPRCG